MYEIGVSATFEAIHRLRGPFGPATERHGHHYRVDAIARGPTLDEHDALCDVAMLQTMLNSCARDLNGHDLDELPIFTDRNSTAENVAHYLFDTIAKRLAAPGVMTLSVRVWESPTIWAGFEGALLRDVTLDHPKRLAHRRPQPRRAVPTTPKVGHRSA
jgi:6-pyruvoyltetrahydropterin/6-carboxytetrahydropterin synthase